MREKKERNAPEEVLRLIASAERSSEHPLAKVLCAVGRFDKRRGKNVLQDANRGHYFSYGSSSSGAHA